MGVDERLGCVRSGGMIVPSPLKRTHPTFQLTDDIEGVKESETEDFRYIMSHDCDCAEFEAWIELWGDFADGQWFYAWRLMNLGSQLTYPRGSMLISWCPLCGLYLADFINDDVCGYRVAAVPT